MAIEIDTMRGKHVDIEEYIMSDDDTIPDECSYFLLHFFPFLFSDKHIIADSRDHGNILFKLPSRIDKHSTLFSVYSSKNISHSFETKPYRCDFDDRILMRVESSGFKVECDECVVMEIHIGTLSKIPEKSKRRKNES